MPRNRFAAYLAGMKLGDTPLVEYTRDRLHRETLRSFGRYELTTAYTPAGQLQSQHLNSLLSDRDYTWNDNGELIRISSPRQTRSYSYSTTGRLTGVHTTAANLDIRIPYATDPAGNRLPDPELHPDSTLSMWPDNRIARDAHYLYRYDRHGRLTEKTDLIPEGVIRTDDERQLTSATGPDGLEIRREYDEWGRLIQETAPDGDITRYRYDNPHSDLPCATEDATGSRHCREVAYITLSSFRVNPEFQDFSLQPNRLFV